MLDLLLGWVSEAMPVFDWPAIDVIWQQYSHLILSWQKLMAVSEVQSEVWQVSADGSVYFSWLGFWKLAHVDARFRPAGAEGAWMLCHYFGSIGDTALAATAISKSIPLK